jgi:hypothetical protein
MYLKIILATFIFSIISSFCPLQKYPKKENDLISLLTQNTNVVYDSGFWSKTVQSKTELMPDKKIIKTRDFVIKFYEKEGYNTNYLKIDNRKIDLRNIYFWRTKENGTASQLWHHAADAEKFKIGNKNYISFRTGIYNCNGSFCIVSYEFLYDLETKKLYVFDLIGYIEFTDVDNDKIIDLLVVNYERNYPDLPIKTTITAYTQDVKGTFRPIADSLGKTYEIKYNIKRNEDTNEEQGIKITKWHWFFEP